MAKLEYIGTSLVNENEYSSSNIFEKQAWRQEQILSPTRNVLYTKCTNFNMLDHCFSNILLWKNPYNNYSYPGEMTRKRNCKQMIVSAQRVLQYLQLQDTYDFFAVFQNSHVFIPLFLSEPQTVFCWSLRFSKTLFFEKHWIRRWEKPSKLRILDAIHSC